jgi:two-component system OmpR family response regulator
VSVVDSGEAAVAFVGQQRIDLLLTDLGMPGMNGLALAQRFRLLAPRVPVVLLTGWGLEADAVRPPNVVSVLGKPVTIKTLNEALVACTVEPTASWSARCS